MEEITYDYYEEENQFGETDTDSKEYENINGYYINISYLNNILSIIVYNLQLLDEKKYGLEIELNDLLKKHNIFKNYRTMKKIFNFLNDLIAEKHFNIKQEGDIIKFCFIPDINQNDNIDFEISLEKKENKENKDEYIKLLRNIIFQSRNEEIFGESSKTTIKTNKQNKNNILMTKKEEEKKETIETKLLFSFNCEKCPLIPAIKLDNKKFNYIVDSICQNGHKNKKIELLDYLDKGKNFSLNNFICQCKKFENTSNNLLYCDTCNIIFCEVCNPEKHSEHKTISIEKINYYCIKHMKQFSSFCKKCQKNICIDCEEEHKNHDIYNFDILIVLEDEFKKKIKKSEKIIEGLKENIKQINNYKNEFLEKIEKLKDIYQSEINLINDFIFQYSKCLQNYTFSYHIIQNLDNIDKFSFDEKNILNEDDSFDEKTQKIMNIFNEVNNDNKNEKIKILKNMKRDETIYSLCFLKQQESLAFGLERKIDIYDKQFNLITSYIKLEGKIAYIKELWENKFLVVDLSKYVKILELKNNEISLIKSIETKDAKNFVGIGLCTKNIICGGDRYLSIIGNSLFFGYSMLDSKDLEGFISNIVEIDSESFLVGQSKFKRIIVYSNKTFNELYRIRNVCIIGNNYSITKINDKYIGISGYEKSDTIKACLYLLSIESKQICTKYYSNNIESFMVIVKLNDNKIIVAGSGEDKDEHSDIILLNIESNSDQVKIKKITEFKRAFCDTLEAITVFNNLIVASDSSSNLKKLEIV